MAQARIADDAAELARRCLEGLRRDQAWLPFAEPLVDLATSGEPSIAAPASRILFRDIVEPLADSFEPCYSEAYRRFFAWLITAVRHKPGFEELDQALGASGIHGEEALIARALSALSPPDVGGVRHIVVPSRVTLGADLAVVSVILAGLSQRFPDATLYFVGGPKNLDLFARTSWIEPIAAPYPRGGSLRERLAVWPRLLGLTEAARRSRDVLTVDPDSRMTQLGLLPLGPSGERRICFDSRAFGGDSETPLAQISAQWLDATFGPAPRRALPWASFDPRPDLADGKAPIAAVSFGLGGNLSKRVSEGFEAAVVDSLHQRGFRVALDRGLGPEEHERVQPLARRVESAGGIVHEGSFRGFAEIVAASTLFVGYDSSFGHLAAALGVPGVTVFAGAVSERMRQRWSPSGAGQSTVIAAAKGESPASVLRRFEEALP